MCDIPLDLQRKFEQRWAARFARPAPPVAPKEELEGQDQPPATRGKAKRKPRRVEAVLEIFIAGLKSRASAKTYPAPHPGAGLSGAPLTETGPTGLGSRDVFLRDVRARARAFGCGMEEVVSGVTAFCRESTRANSEES